MTPTRLDWTDRDACHEWIRNVGVAVEDLAAVVRDQLRAPRKRELGPVLAAREAKGAAKQLSELLKFARAGLEDDEPDSGDPAGCGGAGPH
jgi:hypothetical protein